MPYFAADVVWCVSCWTISFIPQRHICHSYIKHLFTWIGSETSSDSWYEKHRLELRERKRRPQLQSWTVTAWIRNRHITVTVPWGHHL